MLKFLRAFLHLGAEDETPPPETTQEDPSLELDLEGEEPTPPAQEPPEVESPALRVVRERAEAAEAELQRLRQARAAEPAPLPASRDTEYEREERQLADYRASGATAEQLSWLEWKIGVDRKQRESDRRTMQVTQSAADLADKTQFDRLEVTQPKRYKHFAPKVEQAVADMRARGQVPPPRISIYRYLLGEAVENGTFKAAPKGAAPAAPTVPRGKPAPGRSDINPKDKSGMTEHQKRIERMKAAHARGEYL